jgi:hypothetical protein
MEKEMKGWLRGEDHPGARLTWEKVRVMIARYETGEWSVRQLAKVDQVSPTTVYKIVTGKLWREPTPVIVERPVIRGVGKVVRVLPPSVLVLGEEKDEGQSGASKEASSVVYVPGGVLAGQSKDRVVTRESENLEGSDAKNQARASPTVNPVREIKRVKTNPVYVVEAPEDDGSGRFSDE